MNNSNHYYVFDSGVEAIFKITSSTEIKLLHLLCSNSEFNTGVCNLSNKRRKDFCIELNVSPNALSVALCRLGKKGLVINCNGMVKINPHHFWRGDLSKRGSNIKKLGIEDVVTFSAFKLFPNPKFKENVISNKIK